MTKKREKSRSQKECDKPGKLIVALMSPDIALMKVIEGRLSDKFGDIDLRSDPFPFDHTDYYTKEIGGDLQKKFLSFYEMIPVESLPNIKNFTNEVEQQYAIEGKRRVNIDPGYVTHAQMVLATTKDYTHRIYLGKGVYADLEYVCRRKVFQPLEWTYPDYREKFSLDFFQQVREKYLQQMRARRE
jgi:hypothetical protein